MFTVAVLSLFVLSEDELFTLIFLNFVSYLHRLLNSHETLWSLK
jgi:hypothetical protein